MVAAPRTCFSWSYIDVLKDTSRGLFVDLGLALIMTGMATAFAPSVLG